MRQTIPPVLLPLHPVAPEAWEGMELPKHPSASQAAVSDLFSVFLPNGGEKEKEGLQPRLRREGCVKADSSPIPG